MVNLNQHKEYLPLSYQTPSRLHDLTLFIREREIERGREREGEREGERERERERERGRGREREVERGIIQVFISGKDG